MYVGEILLRQLRLDLHRAAFRKVEQRAGTRADDLPQLDIARKHQSRARGDDVELADLGARGAELRLGDPDLGVGCVTLSTLRIDFGLRNKSASLERNRAIVV